MNAVDTSFRAIIRVVGDAPDSERQYALDKTAALGRFAGAPVLGAHVTTWAGRRGRLAAVEVEIDGTRSGPGPRRRRSPRRSTSSTIGCVPA
jgi:hypothetical protein